MALEKHNYVELKAVDVVNKTVHQVFYLMFNVGMDWDERSEGKRSLTGIHGEFISVYMPVSHTF